MRGERWRLSLLGLVVLLSFALRAYRLDYQYLWVDEGLSVYTARLPLWEIPAFQAVRVFSHPPFYHILLGVWIRIAGDSPEAVRYLSLFFSILAIPLVENVGRRLLGSREGLLAAFLAAIAPMMVYYAQETRMYALVTFLTLLVLAFLARLQDERQKDGRLWLGYGASMALALYTHYYGLLVFAGLTILVPLLLPLRNLWRRWLVVQGVVLALFLPWVAFALGLRQSLGILAERSELREPLDEVVYRTLLSFGTTDAFLHRHPGEGFLAIPFLLVTTLGLSVVLFSRGRRAGGLFLAGFWFVPLGLALVIPWRIEPRHLLLTYGALLVLAALFLAWSAARSRLLALGLLILLVGPWAWVLREEYSVGRDAKGSIGKAIRELQGRFLSGERVIVSGAGAIPLFEYYNQGRYPAAYVPTNDTTPLEAERIPDRLEELTRTYRGLWLLLWGPEERGQYVRYALDARAYELTFDYYSDSLLYSYATGDVPTVPMREEVPFGGKMVLTGYALDRGPLRAGEALRLELRFRPLIELKEPVAFSLRLLGTSGQIEAQRDWWPTWVASGDPSGSVEERGGLRLPGDIAPGNYRVELVVYHPWTGEPWVPSAGERRTTSGLILGEVEITP